MKQRNDIRGYEGCQDLSCGYSASPQFIGRAVVALAPDSNMMQKSGQVVVAASLAQEYSFTDVDGKQPRPLTLEEA